ncbi:hybrid sensor histidine kinase/response regulator [Desulfogranum mediterraneum]|uniref:hybrid sensor histidine kinase/response regulator n=1 Tax=Desulfogranum mediterraneum TaxID=160661 RepID=UPI0003F4F9B6|nr:PAS domain S-box protein [Desulfogranum mediterraneum]
MKLSLRSKMTGAYAVILLTMVLLVGHAFKSNREIYIEEIGRSSQLLAEEMFKRMDQRLFELARQLELQMSTEMAQQLLSASNQNFTQLPDIQAHLREQDKIWTTSSGEMIPPMMAEAINTPLARQFREMFILDLDRPHNSSLIQEIIITNSYGATVAASAQTSAYLQTDESWWLAARKQGIYLGRLLLDKSAGEYGIKLALRIDDPNGQFAGVIMAVLNVRDIIRAAEVGIRKYRTSRIQIITRAGQLIYSTSPYRFLADLSKIPFFQHALSDQEPFTLKDGRQTRIYAASASQGVHYLQGFDWILIISHQLNEVLAPYTRVQQQLMAISWILIVACLFLIYKLNRMVTVPLSALTAGIHRLRDGEQNLQVSVPNRDEFAQVATAFNEMVAHREMAAERLRRSEERYRSLFNNARDMIHIIDPNQRIIDVNSRELEIMGYQREEYLGLSLKELIHPDHQDEASPAIAAVMAGRGVDSFETALITRQGKKVFVEVSASPYLEEGSVVSVRAIMRDVSERKATEEARAKIEAQLRQSQKMEAIGTLAGGIAHDFNNLLSVILGYAELAKDMAEPDSKLGSYFDHILGAGNRAKELVKQILAFSRQAQIERIPLQLQSLVKETLKMLRASIPTTIQIRDKIDASCGRVKVDPTQIHQVLMNLCTNAYQAMEASGGTLRITLDPVRQEEQASLLKLRNRPATYVVLTVSDTGVGIPPEILDRIYDPFFTTKTLDKGTGMGLAIVHGIVTDSDGFITVESTPGQGSTFSVYLPVVEERAVSPSQETEELPQGQGHILLVDDEKVLAEMTEEILVRLGYTVTIRDNGFDALFAFSHDPEQYDLILTDQTMPGMTGAELARRALELKPGIPIILCTGYSSLIDEQSAKDIGIREFAAKPLTRGVLAKLLKRVLQG